MTPKLSLPLNDFSSPDRASIAKSIREACLDYGFFYLINHGIDKETLDQVFAESKKFFSLPLDEKMKLEYCKDYTGYSPMYTENLDPSSKYTGDLKESFYIGPIGGNNSSVDINQWPSEESLPFWRATMEEYHKRALSVGKLLVSLIALALNLDEQFFEKIGAVSNPGAFIRLLRYPGELKDADVGNYGASAHSDFGMLTLLATDGVPGLQICRDEDREPQLWEDVHHVDGALIINIGDMLERWTNCIFRSTLHRVLANRKERYSVAFFLDPNSDCIVECLESCCSEMSPPRFPPIRSGDYSLERLRSAYAKFPK